MAEKVNVASIVTAQPLTAVKRNQRLDIMRGTGIFFMVAGHCAAPFTHFIYLFHMALFFMASGFFYRRSYAESVASVGKFIHRKFRTLWCPYVFLMVLLTLLHNSLIGLNIYTDNPRIAEYVANDNARMQVYYSVEDVFQNIVKIVFLRGREQLAGPFWFVAILIKIQLMYCIADFFIARLLKRKAEQYANVIQNGISVALLAFGYWCFLNHHLVHDFSRAFSFYCLFHIGFWLSKKGEPVKTVRGHVLLFIGSAILLGILNGLGSIELSANSYKNPLYLLLTSCAGWYFMYEIAVFLEWRKIEPVCGILAFLGRNTMPILALHLLCFKTVNFMVVIWQGLPLFSVAAFPILSKGGGWWIAYATVGIAMPLLLNMLWKKIQMTAIHMMKSSRST